MQITRCDICEKSMEGKNNQTEEMTLDKLATLVQNGFIELKNDLETKINEVKADTEEIKMDLNKKVDIFTYNDLKYRVEKLEKKFA